MADEAIPEDVKQFILQYIDSIAHWEGLLLLRANSHAEWDAPAIARSLYIGDPEAAKSLRNCRHRGS